ncbi:hypothetical protein ACFWR9_03225, partial [Streptomyces sp. NPDC058534]|uniref:hypothetical protein n=1 Tax=Streptomyces sp. NPDC058534 TaxID=3346541 RepID=UPI00364AB63E
GSQDAVARAGALAGGIPSEQRGRSGRSGRPVGAHEPTARQAAPGNRTTAADTRELTLDCVRR